MPILVIILFTNTKIWSNQVEIIFKLQQKVISYLTYNLNHVFPILFFLRTIPEQLSSFTPPFPNRFLAAFWFVSWPLKQNNGLHLFSIKSQS